MNKFVEFAKKPVTWGAMLIAGLIGTVFGVIKKAVNNGLHLVLGEKIKKLFGK